MNNEEWRSVVGFEGLYEVSNFGRVRSVERYVTSRWGSPKSVKARILALSFSYQGYLRVGLNKDGKRTCHFVQRLVTAAFLGPIPEGMEVAHNDGSKTNNVLNNLRYSTHVDNMADIKKHGTAADQRGEKGPGAKLTIDQVLSIREMGKSGATQDQIAAKFMISRANVSMIVSRRTWSNV